MNIASKAKRRLERLEEQMSPNAEPIIIDVVFVNAAKETWRLAKNVAEREGR